MPLELTDAELATAATACRAMAYQEGERAKKMENPTTRGPIESAARRYAALAEKLDAVRSWHGKLDVPRVERRRDVLALSASMTGGPLMKTLFPSDITQADVNEIKRLEYGLRTNEPITHDRAALAHLIELGWARADGTAVRITDLGYQVLSNLR